MRKLLVFVGVLLLAHVALSLVRPRGAAAGTLRPGAVHVGVVFDVGGRGDKSFNDAAYRGAQRAARELGVQVRYIEPGEGSDREAGLRLMAAEGMDVVIGVGFIFSDDLYALAREYPKVKFVGIDYAVRRDARGRVVPLPPNLDGIKFREQEGSFLVGALAALVSPSKKLGYVGGMDIPLTRKFEAGYRAGVKRVCPSCTVLAQYAGVTPEAFHNPGRGQELALGQYQAGVDIIFQVAGSTGLGVFEAARQMHKLAIGVDSDQYDEAPGFILTSMVKRVDRAVFDAIRDVKRGTFRGGIHSLGLAEHGVDYVYDAHNRGLIPDAVHARVEKLRREIIAGRIHVPSRL